MTKCAFILFPECRFVLENFVIDRHVRYILTVYPVVIVALVGNVMVSLIEARHCHSHVHLLTYTLTYLLKRLASITFYVG